MTDTIPPTGDQYLLRSPDGRTTAEITQVGAALRALTVGGVDLVPRYPLASPSPAASGIVLVPWPGRVRDGRWSLDGQSYELALTDRATGNASHGLLRFASYTAAARDEASVTLTAPVVPQSGYPFHLASSVTYSVNGIGLQVEHSISNVGAAAAPVAVGTHPYLQIGDVATQDLVLRSPGDTRFVFDEQKLPIGEEPVDAATDLRAGRRVGDLDLDTTFTGYERDADGLIRSTLSAPDGRTLTLWQGAGFDFVQVFTTDRYPGHDLAIAVEPMTAPADALNSGRGLRWLSPGETWLLQWGLSFEASPTD